MISKPLFLRSLKSNYKLAAIFIVVLSFYFLIIVNMFDPINPDIMNQLASLKLSPELLSAMGFTLSDTSLLGFIASYFYGLLMVAFPIICYSIIGNNLVSVQVDRGFMAYLLSTPNTRKKIAATQAIFQLCTITTLIVFVTILGIIFCEIQFAGLLDIGGFIGLNVGVLLLHFALSGIGFFASCFFNESKNSAMMGSGLPITFLLIQMISNTSKELEGFKYFTINTLFNPLDIIHGEGVAISMITLFIVGVVLYLAAIAVFDKKDLPI